MTVNKDNALLYYFGTSKNNSRNLKGSCFTYYLYFIMLKDSKFDGKYIPLQLTSFAASNMAFTLTAAIKQKDS